VKLLPVPALFARDRSMRRVFVTTIALCCLLLVPATAHASGRAVIRDCTDDGKLEKSYSQKDYRDALANLPTDVDEYTDCRDVIRRAQLGAAGGGGGGGNGGPGAPGGGSGGDDNVTPNGPAEKAALAKAQKGGGAPIHIGDRTVTPGGSRFTSADVRNSVPTSLLVVLIMLGAGVLTAGVMTARNRVLGRRKS
jgi:hypothetical protein